MCAPVVLWQPHGETGRELVSVLTAGGGRPIMLLQPDDRTLESAPASSVPELSVVRPADRPPSLPDVVRALGDMLERWGPPSGAVLMPRPGPSAPFHELAVTDWRTLVEDSFLGTIFLLRAIIPLTLAGPAARIVAVLPDDPVVGRHDRAGVTANSALRAALRATLAELSREPGAGDTRWFTLREGWALRPEVAARIPDGPAADSAPGLARLCHWLVCHGPADLSGLDLSLRPPATCP